MWRERINLYARCRNMALLLLCAVQGSAMADQPQQAHQVLKEERSLGGALRVRRREVLDDGDVAMRVLQYIRGTNGVLLTCRFAAGTNTTTVNSYSVSRDGVFHEVDSNGDGFFELMIFCNKAGVAVEAFERSSEGTVCPVADARLFELAHSQFVSALGAGAGANEARTNAASTNSAESVRNRRASESTLERGVSRSVERASSAFTNAASSVTNR